ncbi:MAG: PSD1 and planctomycete cytochrome C domain-containing protein [Akkermansiaceae bacterium]|nr:PSD1 and planctomycete cytochrome C domain-containing protein [Akkermansiaceae bacterium]
MLLRTFITTLILCSSAGAEISFNQDIRPILSAKCIMCHGPDDGVDAKGKANRKAGLRLDTPEGAYAVKDGIQAIKPGSLEDSEAWIRITDKADPMPPEDGHAKPLSSAEKDLIRRWIAEGGEYEDFWAFVPAKKQNPPGTKNSTWPKSSIDEFTLAKMEAKGKSPKARANKRTLIRRLSLDLTGLPPTLDEIKTFLDDISPKAYAKLVDRLMAKPAYGEHMAKYWLDLVRVADTNGNHHDHFRDHSPYRDWVIKAFNENLPYNEFTKFQIAGDLYEKPTQDQLIASGFNRLHLIIDRGTALPEESHFKNVVDRVSAVGTTFMGLTMGCAVCHDHKYDPITQKDFYQMYAFFNNFDGNPETGGRGGPDFYRGLQPPYLDLPNNDQKAKLAEFDAQFKSAQDRVARIKTVLGFPVIPADDPEFSEMTKEQVTAKLKEAEKKPGEIQKQRSNFLRQVRGAMVMRERKDINPAHIRIRGDYATIGEKVSRNTPAFLPPLKASGEIPSRMDLANWLVDQKNPLTARIAVNRFWQQLFGTGIVKTSEDFGAQGMWPSHPKLLDHLTLQFMESGWDVKAFMKSLVLSETYQQSSSGNSVDFETDPENLLLARGSRTRLDSEVIRDQLLSVTGLLNPGMGGRSIKTPQPAGLWKMVALPSSFPNKFEPATGPDTQRRSIYTFWKRGLAPPQMTIFDAPSRDACIARRERTNTPLQALLLMNETEYFNAAAHKAKELISWSGSDDEKLKKIHETITAQQPDEATLKILKEGLASFKQGKDDQFAWTMIVHTLLNQDSFKNKE